MSQQPRKINTNHARQSGAAQQSSGRRVNTAAARTQHTSTQHSGQQYSNAAHSGQRRTGTAARRKKKRSRIRWWMPLLVVLALAFAYLFLLLGEPDDDAKYLEAPAEERILMPMNAVETPGEANVQGLADSFDQAVLSLNGTLSMRRARIYDTAFEGGYARRVTLTYVFEDGTLLTAESLRPTAAATLFKLDGGTLDGSSLYTLGGLNAARMDNADTVCVFAQSDAAVYAILCPASHAQELDTLLHATLLTPPQQAD